MEKVIYDYYSGFEGEGEIQFISISEKNKSIIRIWDGYFDEIMDLMEPDETGWSGLAYHYHMSSGWYEKSPWELLDVQEALSQFERIDNSVLREATLKALKEICQMLTVAIEQNEKVQISKE